MVAALLGNMLDIACYKDNIFDMISYMWNFSVVFYSLNEKGLTVMYSICSLLVCADEHSDYESIGKMYFNVSLLHITYIYYSIV